MEKLKEIRELDAHFQSNPSYLELFHRIADIALKELDPLASEKTEQKKTDMTPPAESKSTEPKKQSRYIPAGVRRAVWKRDQSQCTYRSPDGKRCTSRYALEIDHRVPYSLGGRTELGNLRLLCRSHNAHQAILKLGERTMRPYLKT
jgi:5-methylcytosine-specific restriction endonuclease McrA